MTAKRGMRIALVTLTALACVAVTWYGVRRARDASSRFVPVVDTRPGPTAPQAGPMQAEIPSVDVANIDPAVAQAIREAQAEVKANRQSAKTWGALGETLLAHEFHEAANAAFAEASRLAPTEPKWHYLRGRSFDLYVTEEAAAPYEEAVRLIGDKPDAPLLTLIELYLAIDRPADAQKKLAPFLKKHPDNARANLAMGRLMFQQGDLVRALEHARMAETNAATHKGAHQLIGQIYLRQGNTDEARKHQQRAAQLTDQGWPDPYYREVVARRTGLKVILVEADRLFGKGDVQGSIVVLRQAVKTYPGSDWAHVLLGRALIRERQLSEAEQVLRRAIGLAPASVEAQFRLGVAIYMQRRPKEAADWFRRAIKLKPDFTMAHYNLGHCLVELKDIPGAIGEFEATANSDPTMYDAQAILGTLLAQEGRTDEAITHWTKALELRPNDPKATAELTKLTGESGGQ